MVDAGRTRTQAEGPDNPTLFIVAVADAEGRCAVGMATGVGTFDDGVIADDAPSRCTAEAAAGAARRRRALSHRSARRSPGNVV